MKHRWAFVVVVLLALWWLQRAATAGQSKATKYEGPSIDPSTGNFTPFEGPNVNPLTGAYTGRVTQELTIDANVYSPTFGEPIDPQAGDGSG